MQKGTLDITRSNREKIIVKINFIKKNKPKSLTVTNTNITDLSLTGKEVEFERDKNGHIIKIVNQEGKELFSKAAAVPLTAKAGGKIKKIHEYNGIMITSHTDSLRRRAANAPYNFIPLNEKVVEAEKIPDFDKYHEDRKTGWIDITIETITPVYIRDTLDNDEIKQQEEAKKKNRPFIHPDFFSPGGGHRIPGSTIRGMARNMIEMVSFGKFVNFDDKRLYFRAMADRATGLKETYDSKMVQTIKGVTAIQPLAGYLKKRNNRIVIVPAKTYNNDNITFYKINESKLIGKSFYPEPMSLEVPKRDGGTRIIPNRDYKFVIQPVVFKKKSPKSYSHRGGEIFLYYGKVTDIDLEENVSDLSNWKKGTLVCTGWMYGKHMHWVINEESENIQPLTIDDKLLQSYKDDVDRCKDANANLLIQLKNHPDGVLCFYITDANGRVATFGHTGMFRLPYEKSIKAHVPEYLHEKKYAITPQRLNWIETDKSNVPADIIESLDKMNPCKFSEDDFEKKVDKILADTHKRKEYKNIIYKHTQIFDISEAIFGNESLFAGRVFFEDAFLCQGQKDELMGEEYLKILSSPKPTSFQHYLVQHSDNTRNIKHYDDNVSIRGYKLYWHKSGDENNWKENPNQIRENDTQHTKVKPIKPKKMFSGRIRFENLTFVELGALLFSFDLPQGCHHKIGMGKPLGLGSIKITPKLYLSKRTDRYNNLYSEWNNAIKASDKTETDTLKTSFENYVLGQIDETSASELWQTERLKELLTMLDYKKGNELEKSNKISYMSIQRKEFTERLLLPLPTQV